MQTTIDPEILTRDLFDLESYNYDLPAKRIALYPAKRRDASRLLVLNRSQESFADHYFRDLPDLLQNGDLLVLNNTRVLPARFHTTNGEVLLVRKIEEESWDSIVFPGKNFRTGNSFEFPGGIKGEVLSTSAIGRVIRIHGNVNHLLENSGEMPLPPYIEREAEAEDRKNYQTIFARIPGSIAAPTAGLHFTRKTFTALRQKQIDGAQLTLHVGPGTFRPVKKDDIRQHQIDSEFYHCSPKSWSKIQNAKRVIAVGTTTTRALETIYRTGKLSGRTDLFIYPGHKFHAIQGLITNFHLPKSSLLMLVSAFAGYDFIRKAYQHAIERSYRFYSYGDAMLIL